MTAHTRKKTKGKSSSLALAWLDFAERSQTAGNDDPLGLLHLEDQIANWFWPGFSRKTLHPGYFLTVLYGILIAEKATAHYGLPKDDDTRRFLFGRFERVWGMSQFVAAQGVLNPEDEILGSEGTSRAYHQSKRNYPTDYLYLKHGEIGALGVYLPSLRAHRLVSHRRLRLTPLGLELSGRCWGGRDVEFSGIDEFFVKALNPRLRTIPQRVGRMQLRSVGEAAGLGRIAKNPELQSFLRKRLLDERPPPSELSVLPQMADHLVRCKNDGVDQPRALLEALAERRGGSGQADLKRPAMIALSITDLGRAMLRIFDRTSNMILAEGYSADWSDCVQAAVIPELVQDLNQEMARYRSLACNEQIEALSSGGRAFGQTMRRFSTQNPYNTFESILNLHNVSRQALGRGEGWLGRSGETVFLRQASTGFLGSSADAWRPSFRMTTMQRFLDELGYF